MFQNVSFICFAAVIKCVFLWVDTKGSESLKPSPFIFQLKEKKKIWESDFCLKMQSSFILDVFYLFIEKLYRHLFKSCPSKSILVPAFNLYWTTYLFAAENTSSSFLGFGGFVCLFCFVFAFWLMFSKSHILPVNHSPFPYNRHLEIIYGLWSWTLESFHPTSVLWKFIFLQSFLEPLSHFGCVILTHSVFTFPS